MESLIKDVEQLLIEKGIPHEDFIIALRNKWKDEECIVWSVDDVIERYKDICVNPNPVLDKDIAREILKRSIGNHDASYGFSSCSFDDEFYDRDLL